ncbi:pre-mRNA 3'-end-processing factor FIP1 [Sitophilus oryzae]|uniref:Pre-mRNA 3'-end-processing factor FIP1 n=1 Tax=Sitophilus oryzae TaxID=7048 RepID=A0A6J2XE53_SITOR|nr:pre-mRNA 3'-end-processing factor FIP1 [Sitophilus oryzae]
MADDVENDDQWLYGDNPDGNPPEEEKQTTPEEAVSNDAVPPIEPSPINYPQEQSNDDRPPGVEDENEEKENGEIDNEREDGELRQNGDDDEDLDDESDDDVNVVIGDIKTTTSYPQQVNIKRGVLATAIVDKSKSVQQTGKFQVEEFEQIGTINGVPASDYNLDSLEDKPWRKPGADITDYFNYGFNEDTWKAYCERQKRIRINESGVGIVPLNAIGLPRGSVSGNDNNKYPNQGFMQGSNIRPIQTTTKANEPPKMNTIQVMTADRREYSRKPGFPDMSVPPPNSFSDPFPPPEYGFNPEPEPFYGGYEPTQDSQWMDGPVNSSWQPSEIKTLTGGSPPRPGGHGMGPPPRGGRSPSRRSSSRDRERDREREESRSRSVKPRDYEREKSRRRERSRSRSRRHRSRSRSPGHRSHKKKKSRRHEDSD